MVPVLLAPPPCAYAGWADAKAIAAISKPGKQRFIVFILLSCGDRATGPVPVTPPTATTTETATQSRAARRTTEQRRPSQILGWIARIAGESTGSRERVQQRRTEKNSEETTKGPSRPRARSTP